MKIIYEDTNQELHEIPLHPKTPEENYIDLMKEYALLEGVEPVRAWLETCTEEELWEQS